MLLNTNELRQQGTNGANYTQLLTLSTVGSTRSEQLIRRVYGYEASFESLG